MGNYICEAAGFDKSREKIVDKLKPYVRFVCFFFRSTTSIPKNLFDNFELVSSNDNNVDPELVVYMDSDSEGSEKTKCDGPVMQDVALQEVVNPEKHSDSTEVPENPMHFTIKKEEELSIDDTEPIDSDDAGLEYYENLASPIPAKSSSFGFDVVMTEPPPNMPTPTDSVDIHVGQFQIIRDIDLDKTDEITADLDTSLVDHPYSQPETRNKEFCDDLVQEMLVDTGNAENDSAIQLLSKFTEITEHFMEDSPTSQLSMYIRSMKKTLKDRTKSLPAKPNFEEVPDTQEELEVALKDESAADDSIEIPETQDSLDLLQEVKSEIKLEPQKFEESYAQQQVDQAEETNKVVNIKKQVELVKEFGDKLSGHASALLALCEANEDDELAGTVQDQLRELLNDSLKEYSALASEIDSRRKKEKELRETSKNMLQTSDSTDYVSSDSEDIDQAVNLNRKIPKKEAKTSNVVSSTKEDPNVSEADAGNLKSLLDSSLESDSEIETDIDKDIEKLADLSALNCPKPVSSRTISRSKPKKKKKRLSSGSDSSLRSSTDENLNSSSTVSCQNILFILLYTVISITFRRMNVKRQTKKKKCSLGMTQQSNNNC